MKLPDQDEYKLKQKIIDIFAGWDRLKKSQGEHYVLVTPSGSPHFLIYTALQMSPDAGLIIVYGLNHIFLKEWLVWSLNPLKINL